MRKEKKLRVELLLLGCIFLTSLVYCQTEPQALQEQPVISVVGRLALEKLGQKEELVLHAKNAQTYLITGNLSEKLKNALLELGENNLVSVSGSQDRGSSLSCEQFYEYVYNKKGERELKTEVKCIRYYNLEVTQIVEAKKSNEEIPPPKRDIEEEERVSAENIGRNLSLTPLVVGEIYGKITSLNLKSPINTLEIANQDKDSPLKNIILILTADTVIAKKIGEKEPMVLSKKALAAGQEVTAVYRRDELKAEALFITITKE